MTTIERLTVPEVRGGRRTPSWLYRLISSRALRAVLGWDLPRYDVRVISRRPGTVCLEVGSGGGFYTKALKTHRVGHLFKAVSVEQRVGHAVGQRKQATIAGDTHCPRAW